MSLKTVVSLVANEKGLSEKVVLGTVKESILNIINKKFKLLNLEVAFDKDGCYKVYVVYIVVNDLKFNISINNSFRNIPLKLAKLYNLNIRVGDRIRKKINIVNIGRSNLLLAKNLLYEKIKEKEKSFFFGDFNDKLGKVVSGIIKQANRDFYLVNIASGGHGILYKSDSIPKDFFKKNDRVKAFLKAVCCRNGYPEAILSRRCNEILTELFIIEVPEIKSGIIEIMGVVRDPGNKSKVAIRSSYSKIDLIGTCVGIGGSRIKNISRQLCGEKIDLILWDKEIIKYVVNIFTDVEIKYVEVDEKNMLMNVYLRKDAFRKVNEKSSQTINFAERLTGWSLNVLRQD